MLKRIVALTILYFMKALLWTRYRVTVKGVDRLTKEALNKPGGILFLPNHPTIFVDPTLVTLAIYQKYPLRPLIVEYMYYLPGVNWIMRFMNALPIPNFKYSSNSLKRKRSERAIQEVVNDLRKGENFMIYPAGRVKLTNYEAIGGASGVHTILQNVPESNVVLVRTEGLFGSIFSTALTGKVPLMFPSVMRGVKIALKNLIFFSPRRDVTIEFFPAPKDFPLHASRLEMNQWLEKFYNQPYENLENGQPATEYPGEPLKLISHSLWKEDLPEIKLPEINDGDVDMSKVPEKVRNLVFSRVAELAETDPESLTLDTNLSSDLGMDSLDGAELLLFLEDEFGITGVPPNELTTIERLIGIASKQLHVESDEELEEVTDLTRWRKAFPHRQRAYVAKGKTIPEAFLHNCQEMGNRIACADDRAGVLTYPAVKMRALLLAEYIRKLPGDHIGILLPSSVAASLTILACQLARKVPVMINWTVGPKHLESVVELSGIQKILTSWAFLERLENVDLDAVEEQLIFLEDLKSELKIKDKLQALYRSKLSTKKLIKLFGLEDVTENNRAVILFTSGTESVPKGVPLTYKNILENQRAAMNSLEMTTQDTFFAILPPFHAFGFAITSLIPLLSGVRVAFYPNPTEGPKLAKGLNKWGITAICGAPTFLKGMLKAASQEDVKKLRYLITGAEKAPPEMYQLAEKLGIRNTIIEGYGITECSPVLTINRWGEEHVGVGRPLENVELTVVHPDRHELLPQGDTGLILARGPNVFRGYLNPGLASPFKEVDGKYWYNTGDLGFLDEKNHLILAGRQKRFVKVGGEMISLAAIEDALLSQAENFEWSLCEDSPSIAVIAEERESGKPRIYLFTTFKTTVEEANKALREDGFSNLVKVSEHQQLTDIPIMGSGKIFYRDLQDRYLSIDKPNVTV